MIDSDFKKYVTMATLLLLIILSFFILKPILLPIIIGLLLVYIVAPVYNALNKKIHSKNLSTTIITIGLLLLIIIPVWLLTPIAINQSIKIYMATQKADFVTPLKNIFPSLLASDEFSNEIGQVIQSFVAKTANKLMNSLATLITNFVTFSLQLIVVFFTFFFVLRDKEAFIEYIKSLMPFPQHIENKLFLYSQAITSSVIYGQVIVGIIQGLVIGIGFFIFGVPNAFLLTLLAILAGIFPIIGTSIIWVPVAIYLLIGGGVLSVIGLSIFGIISVTIDNFLRPLIVSKRTQIHSGIILIGMIGGLFIFGVMGFILGPLILAYLMIILELYRKKPTKKFLE